MRVVRGGIDEIRTEARNSRRNRRDQDGNEELAAKSAKSGRERDDRGEIDEITTEATRSRRKRRDHDGS